MFVDASVIVAIINQEPGWEELAKRLQSAAKPVYVSAICKWEAVLGIARAAALPSGLKPTSDIIATARELVEQFLGDIGAREVTISLEIGNRAIEAAATYGKSVGHPADLNLGDCFSYACAKSYRLPLLYKGNDFGQTDIDVA